MIKNIIFDIGGVILNFNSEVLIDFLRLPLEEIKRISKIVYSDKRWHKCLLGNMSQEEYMKLLIKENNKDKEYIEKILKEEYQENVLPVMQDTIDLIYRLKQKGYKLYILSNLTESTYNYIENKVKILDIFDGQVISFKDKLEKPNKEIYNLILERYNLDKSKTIFFDDSQRNIEAAKNVGINSIQFKSIEDIINNIEI